MQFPAYSYLLGMYLGDGYIARYPRAYVLRVYLHQDQRDIAERVGRAITTLLPLNRVNLVSHRHARAMAVTCYSQAWPRIFPQHGPGRKHSRPIILEPWQREIVERHPGEFIRGCIESDGSRHRRIVKGKNYPAYSFKNRSSDILRLFKEGCQLLGLHPCRASSVTISIARRADVARLDAILGRPVEPGPFLVARERIRAYRARSNVGKGLPSRKLRIPKSSCRPVSRDRPERHHRAGSNGSCGVGWTSAGIVA